MVTLDASNRQTIISPKWHRICYAVFFSFLFFLSISNDMWMWTFRCLFDKNIMKKKKKQIVVAIKLKWWLEEWQEENKGRFVPQQPFHSKRNCWNGMESTEHQEFETWTYWLLQFIVTLRLPTEQIIKIECFVHAIVLLFTDYYIHINICVCACVYEWHSTEQNQTKQCCIYFIL